MFDLLAIDKQKLGFPKNAQERKQRLERAYNKALLLDDELVQMRDQEILRKEQERRKKEIEKAKSLKKFVNKSSPSVQPASSREALGDIYDKFFAAS